MSSSGPTVVLRHHGLMRRVDGTWIILSKSRPKEPGARHRYAFGSIDTPTWAWLADNGLSPDVTFTTIREARQAIAAVLVLSAPPAGPQPAPLTRRRTTQRTTQDLHRRVIRMSAPPRRRAAGRPVTRRTDTPIGYTHLMAADPPDRSRDVPAAETSSTLVDEVSALTVIRHQQPGAEIITRHGATIITEGRHRDDRRFRTCCVWNIAFSPQRLATFHGPSRQQCAHAYADGLRMGQILADVLHRE